MKYNEQTTMLGMDWFSPFTMSYFGLIFHLCMINIDLKWNEGMKGNAILLLPLPVQSVDTLDLVNSGCLSWMTYLQAMVVIKDKSWAHQQFYFKDNFFCGLILIFAKKLKIDLHVVVVTRLWKNNIVLYFVCFFVVFFFCKD